MIRSVVFSLSIALGFCLGGCDTPAKEAPPAGQPEVRHGASDPAGETKKALYIEVCAANSHSYWYDHKVGLEKIGERLGVDTEFVGPPEYDMDAMITAFEQAIAKRPNGILVVGFEPCLNAVVDKAMASGIPVVTVDADLPDSQRIAFVGTGNHQAGFRQGELLAGYLGGKGKVAVTTMPDASNLQERLQGFKDAVAKYPEMEVVHVIDTQGDQIAATQACIAVLQKYPDLAGIAATEAVGGGAAATAVREAGMAGRIKIVAMDRGNEILEAIEDGIIEASIVQQTMLMPIYGLRILHDMDSLAAQITTNDKEAGVRAVPPFIDSGTVIVDKSNCRYFVRSR
jgi:ribose transport system substrate-binding protein